MFQGAKNLAVNQLPQERGLAAQTLTTNRKPDGKALVTRLLDVCGSREVLKNFDLKVSLISLFTANSKCEFVPRDQVSSLLVFYFLLLPLKN